MYMYMYIYIYIYTYIYPGTCPGAWHYNICVFKTMYFYCYVLLWHYNVMYCTIACHSMNI